MKSASVISYGARPKIKWYLKGLVAFVVSVFGTGIFSLIINNFLTPQLAPKINTYLDDFKRPVILCHRGSRYLGPENTIHTHKWALKMGCDVLEFDIRLTLDKKIVVIHDEFITRTTEEKGATTEYTAEKIRNLDAGYNFSPLSPDKIDSKNLSHYPFRGKGIKIPLLDEFMDTFSDQYMNIEIKDNNNLVAELLWKEISKYPQRWNKILVASGYCRPLKHFRKLSNYQIATNACENEVIAFTVVHKIGIQNLYYRLFRPQAQIYQIPTVSGGIYFNDFSVVEAAHKLNQKLMFWVINSDLETKRLLKYGTDGFITDRPDILYNSFYELKLVEKSFDELTKDFSDRINTFQTLFIPEWTSQEAYICLTLTCRILPFLIKYTCEILLLFGSISAILLIRVNSLVNKVDDVLISVGTLKRKQKLE